MDLPKFDLEYFFLLRLFLVHVVAHSTEPPHLAGLARRQYSVAAGTCCFARSLRRLWNARLSRVGLINDIFGSGAHGASAHRPTITTRIPSAHPI